MLCGHSTGESMRQDAYNGNTVRSLLSDYQTHTRGGNGWLRLLEFSPSNNVIRVTTYSPSAGKEETDNDSQFLMNYDMQQSEAFTQIGQLTEVSSGAVATVLWPNLSAFTEYEWYAAMSDGVSTFESSRCRFTTSSQASPTLAIAAPDGRNQFWMRIFGEPGERYQVETSPELGPR